MDTIPIDLLGRAGVVGLIVLFGLMLATGRLFTRGQVREMQARHESELQRMLEAHERALTDVRHDRGEWRTDSRIKDQTIVELNEQKRAMLTGFETLADFLQGLRRAGIGEEGKP